MNSISQENIKKIALLARIQLSAEEGTQVSSDVSTVLSNFSELKTIDTVGVRAVADASGLPVGRQGLNNVVRTDTENSSVLADASQIMKNVPHVQNGYVRVIGVFS